MEKYLFKNQTQTGQKVNETRLLWEATGYETKLLECRRTEMV